MIGFVEKLARFVGVLRSVSIYKLFFYFSIIFVGRGGFLTLSLG